MKLRIFIFFAIIFGLTGLSFAQDKIDPLPAGSTLDQSRDWLVKALSKNFGYSLIDDTVTIGDVKFDGCRLSYRMVQRYMDSKGTIGDRPSLDHTGEKGVGQDLKYDVYEDVSFDLKDIDPARVGLGPLAKPKGMQMVSLETIGKKDLVRFDRKGSTVRYNTTGNRPNAAFPVKEKAGEAIAKGFMYTVQLCRAGN
jgi:hypothetical protein